MLRLRDVIKVCSKGSKVYNDRAITLNPKSCWEMASICNYRIAGLRVISYHLQINSSTRRVASLFPGFCHCIIRQVT